MEKGKWKLPDISSSTLHILAMVFMLLDHMWATVLPGRDWMTCLGRIAFPLFAFMLVEGYFHTHSFKNYLKRMIIFALISEIPFNLMYGANIFWPTNQSVYVTLIVALLSIHLLESVRKKGKKWLYILTAILVVPISSLLTLILFSDYHGAGIFMVYVFYFFRGRKWWCYVGQFLVLYYICDQVGGLCYIFDIFGYKIEVVRQSFSLLALPIIWLYRGRKGIHSKVFQYACYAFYPVHILILALLMLIF